jgi:hypothetical protein
MPQEREYAMKDEEMFPEIAGPKCNCEVILSLFIIFLIVGLSSLAYSNPVSQVAKKELVEKPEVAETKKKSTVAFTYYFDSRDYNTLNMVNSVPDLPAGLKLWGFIDFNAEQNNESARFELTRYFLEYRLSKPLFPNGKPALKGLNLEVEYNDSNGPDNDVLRFGLTYKHSFSFFSDSKSWLQWRYHPYETDGSGSQISLIYFFPLHERIYINGFADLNFEDNGPDRWVAEPQINFKLTDFMNAVVEFRYNEFEDANASIDGAGIALGLELKF